jgi:hypothetical protein
MRLQVRRNAYVATLVVVCGIVGASTVGAQTLTPAPPPAASPAPLIVEEDVAPYSTALGSHVLDNNTINGLYNTGVGYYALTNNTTGQYNTATGDFALTANTLGPFNTATGYAALYSNTTSSANTATGYAALYSSTGFSNTAVGAYALAFNTTGGGNTALGINSSRLNVTGNFNTAVGFDAGFNALGSNNIYLGAHVEGTAADVNTMRLGLPYDGFNGQNQTFIAGIYGTALPPGSFVPVYINAAGQLGTALPPPVTGNGGQAIRTDLEVLSQQLQYMRARLEATEAANAALQARLAELEARVGK